MTVGARPLTTILLALVATSLTASCSDGLRTGGAARPAGASSPASSGGGLQFERADLGQGRTLRTWLDGSEIHLAFFSPGGRELPVDELEIRATSAQGSDDLRPMRFGSGHFVVPIDLRPGRWRFTVRGSAGPGGPFHTGLSFLLA